MPRRRPRTLRIEQWKPPHGLYRQIPWPTRVDRLFPRTVSAVHRAETLRWGDESGIWPGATAAALWSYRRFLGRRGRHLYVLRSRCGCFGCELEVNVTVARDVLELVVPTLPRRARAELEELLADLDERLWRRTLPDPTATRNPGRAWWHTRIVDETSHL
ncbi:hypothetical protein [Streptomyces sp. TS71-3]|uniref:hypothetical protein n=1 Tax=Streptomyces sp. TS71-3 TaxID=2733862 RepID=UPI001B04C2D6|nr:hypothetical protein [Streptomyces sp. TS71-3]GHJ34562.1 hypothetical protein Sm713_01710 [Streptomyces sp. TS71-3]